MSNPPKKKSPEQLNLLSQLDYSTRQVAVIRNDGGVGRGQTKADRLSSITGVYSMLPKRLETHPLGYEVVNRKYQVGNTHPVLIEISPAVLTRAAINDDGVKYTETYHRYPSKHEDMVEEALAYQVFNKGKGVATTDIHIKVEFTVAELVHVIKTQMKTKISGSDVLLALDVLASSKLVLRFEGDGARAGIQRTRITDYIDVERKGCEIIRSCVLHPVFAKEIAQGNFRLHDLALQGTLKSAYGRDLLKQLTWIYRHANDKNTLVLNGRESLQNSACGFNMDSKDRWRTLERGLKELVKSDILSKYDPPEIEYGVINGKRMTVNKHIRIWPSDQFIKLQKLAYWSENKAIGIEV